MEKELYNYCKKKITGVILRVPGILSTISKNNFLSKSYYKLKFNRDLKISNPNLNFNNLIFKKNLARIIF